MKVKNITLSFDNNDIDDSNCDINLDFTLDDTGLL